MSDVLLIDRRNGFAVATMNRPSALNAMSSCLLQALQQAFDDLENDPTVRGLILTGAGRGFCSGMDMKELQDPEGPLAQQGGLWAGKALNPVMRLARFGKPVIAAVNGPAITGGLELALACDVILASTKASFGDTHARIGIVSGGGASQLLPRVIGPHRAREMSFTGAIIGAEQAERWGIVNRIVEPDQLLPCAEAMMMQILTTDDDMLHIYKRLINDGFGLSFSDALALEEKTAREHANRSGPVDVARRAEAMMNG